MYNYIRGVGEIWVGPDAPLADATNVLWLKLETKSLSNGQLLWWNPVKGHWDSVATDYMLFNHVYGIANPPETFKPVITNDDQVYIGAGAGTYKHFLNENGKPIVINSDTALILLHKGKDQDFWTYKALELKGEKGDSATIVARDTYTASPTEDARVWNSGDEHNAVFNFSIPRGYRGFHYTPSVDDDSNLSWTNDGNLPNPETKNIKGDKGDKGNQGDVGPIGPMPEIVALSDRIVVHRSEIEGDHTVSLDVEQRHLEHDKLQNRDLADAHPINAITNLQKELDNKLDVNPDGSTPLIAGGKVNSRYIPEWILGSVKYGGTFNSDGTISSDEEKLNGKNISTLSNEPTFYETWKGWYFINNGIYTLSGVTYEPGDWAVNNGKAGWQKVDNTDMVTGVKGNSESSYRIGQVNITKANIGLGNVDDTSDINKPVSTATQTALDLKIDKNTPITAGTATKVTYDSEGLIVAGTVLEATDIPELDTSKITTGVFEVARIPDLDASKITTGTLGVDRIPNLDTSNITTGIFPEARGGTGVTDLANAHVGYATYLRDRKTNHSAVAYVTGPSIPTITVSTELRTVVLSGAGDSITLQANKSDGGSAEYSVIYTSADNVPYIQIAKQDKYGEGIDTLYGVEKLKSMFVQLDPAIASTGTFIWKGGPTAFSQITNKNPDTIYVVTLND